MPDDSVRTSIPEQQRAITTGPATVESQPGAKIEMVREGIKFFQWGWVQAGFAFVLVILLFVVLGFVGYLMLREIEGAREDMKEFRAWAEAREEKRIEREDKMRERMWTAIAEIKNLLRSRIDASGLPVSPLPKD